MKSRVCAGCGEPINLLRADAIACSARCRKRISRRPSIPAEFTSRARWVRRSALKRPLTVSGKAASSTDSRTWATYSEALVSKVGVGLGFVLGDGIGCYDLDHCLTGGVPDSWVLEFIASIPERVIFAEVSQGGDGVHLFVEAQEGPGRKIRDGRNIERYTAGRYIAMTGKSFII